MHHIPIAVQNLILKNRKHFHKIDAEIRKKTNGKSGFTTKPLELTGELVFWSMDDDEKMEEFLFEDLLPALFGEIDFSKLPNGYGPLVHVLEFERHCEFEGWYTVSNKTEEEMKNIIRSYGMVGLHEESKALQVVFEIFLRTSDTDDDIDEVLGAAYKAVPNRTKEPEARVAELLKYVRENPSSFYSVAGQ